MCPRRKSHSSHEPYEPSRERRVLNVGPHETALENARVRFSQTWGECGELNKNAKRDHRNEPIENQWLRMVTHKLLKRFHHLGSQLLKEVKQIKARRD